MGSKSGVDTNCDIRNSGTPLRMLPLAFAAAAGVLLATTAFAHETNPLRGCWLKSQPQVLSARKRQMQPRLEYCFKENGRIQGNYAETDGHAGDIEKRWKQVGSSMLQIDADRCTFKYLANDRLLLTDCLDEGEWRLSCRRPKYATTCGDEDGAAATYRP